MRIERARGFAEEGLEDGLEDGFEAPARAADATEPNCDESDAMRASTFASSPRNLAAWRSSFGTSDCRRLSSAASVAVEGSARETAFVEPPRAARAEPPFGARVARLADFRPTDFVAGFGTGRGSDFDFFVRLAMGVIL